MARIRAVSHHTRHDFPWVRVIVHTPIAPEMEQEVEASLIWIGTRGTTRIDSKRPKEGSVMTRPIVRKIAMDHGVLSKA
jgi:hypothetical protein